MNKAGLLTLLGVIVSAAAGAEAQADGMTIATHKSVAQFGGCFVDTQDRASLAWSFVPKADGGTFSNLGAKGAANAYFLVVSNRGAAREIRLETANAQPADARVAGAVNRCA